MENRLIHVGKINALTTQKRGPKIFTRQLGSRIHEKQCYDKAFRHNEHILFQDSDNDSSSSQSSNDSSVSNISNNIEQYTTIDLKYKL